MTRIRLVVAYDGTGFRGFQTQGSLRTVQGELDRVLSRVFSREIRVVGASRTDAGVHAIGQMVHFDVEHCPFSADHLRYILRAHLPVDLTVPRVDIVPDTFHVRHDVTWKTYRYELDTGAVPDVFRARYAVHVPYSLSVRAMQVASRYFLGIHDFSSFCYVHAQQPEKVREIYAFHVEERPGSILFAVSGNGFLHNMVRIMAGTLIDVGRGRFQADEVPEMLAAKNRAKAGPTAPAKGLCLWQISYKPWPYLDETH